MSKATLIPGTALLALLWVLVAAGPSAAYKVDMMSQVFHQNISAEELAAVYDAFPEGGGLDPAYVAAANDPNLHLTSQAEVTFTFIGEGAGYRNSVGYFLYDGNYNILESHTIFSNASERYGGGSLTAGDSVVLGVFEAGTHIGFWLKADGYSNSRGAIYYTLEGLNPDQKRHFALWGDHANERQVFGVEDLPNLGDGDYNDLLFSVSANPYSAISSSSASTPEPASLLLMGSAMAGLVGAGWRRRRRARAREAA